jgi:hypothetical protein
LGRSARTAGAERPPERLPRTIPPANRVGGATRGRPRILAGSARALVLLAAAAVAVFLTAWPGAAHHVGLYTPRDNDVSANFKQIRFALQAGKPDVALTLFETGALRREMRVRRERLPVDLEGSTLTALKAGDAPAVERRLMIFFAGLTRDLAHEADRQLTDSSTPGDVRALTARRFLEAIWRYYNLIDFLVSQHDHKAAVAVRLAFDEAETYVKSDPAVKTDPPRVLPDPDRARESLRRIADTLSSVIEQSGTPAQLAIPTRRDS